MRNRPKSQDTDAIATRAPHLRAVDEPLELVTHGAKRARRRTPSKDTEGFFELPMDHSIVKATIISKYFVAWMNIIKTRTRSGKMAYFDLFAGKGAYDDGTPSTPLLVLTSIIADPVVREQILVLFGDKNADCVEALRANIAALPGIDSLKHMPEVLLETATDVGLDKSFEKQNIVPTFMFLDPFGYEGVTSKLIRAILKDW
jgi:three-Cys-motif partner protein